MEELLADLDALDEDVRQPVVEILDGIDALHRMALRRLAAQLDVKAVQRLRAGDPAVCWLLDAYAIGVDERAAAEAALEAIRPYVHSHGGQVELLDAHAGVVRLRLSGACAGCTASAVTLQEGVEQALRDHFAGFVAMEVEETGPAVSHAPPGPTLVELRPRRH
jgi:Fe-S cluster biogenesis protein NfuA